VGGGGEGVGGGGAGGRQNAVDRFGHAMGYCQALVLFVGEGGGGVLFLKNMSTYSYRRSSLNSVRMCNRKIISLHSCIFSKSEIAKLYSTWDYLQAYVYMF
jgi:hypothetical protein